MAKIRYLTGIILLAIVLIFVGEVYTWYVADFEVEHYYTTFYPRKNTDHTKMKIDIENEANKRDIGVFLVDKVHENIFSVKTYIYANDIAMEYLKKEDDIKEGKLSSILTGSIDVVYCPFKDANVSKLELYYLLGGTEQEYDGFKAELIDRYDGKFPDEGYVYVNSPMYISTVWIICMVLMLLMTFYDIKVNQKKYMIQVINGESMNSIVSKRIIKDTVVFSGIYVILIAILSRFTNCTYYIGLSLMYMGIFLVCNALIYLVLYKSNYKKVFGSGEDEKVFLSISNIYKICSTMLTVFILSYAVSQVVDGIDFYSQKDFFEKYKDYSYFEVSVEDEEDLEVTSKLIVDLYKQYDNMNKAIMLSETDVFSNANKNYSFMFVNNFNLIKNDINIDRGNINFDNDNKVYIFASKNKDKYLEEIKNIVEWDYEGKEIEIVQYEDKVRTLSLKNKNGYKSSYLNNPFIILYHGEFSMEPEKLDNRLEATAIKITDSEWDAFVKYHGIEDDICYKTNVYDNYLNTLAEKKRNIYVGLMISLILLVLEAIIIRNTIMTEYRVNAMELSLKKVLGETFFERNRSIFKLTFISSAIALIGGCVLTYFMNKALIPWVIVGGVIMVCMEVAYITYFAIKMENRNMVKILKGGSL